MKNIWILIAVFLMAASLSACETSQGFGEDVQNLGSEIEDI